MSNEKTVTLAEAMGLKVTKVEEGIVRFDENTFKDTLPKGLTVDTVHQVQDHIKDFTGQFAKTVGIEGAKAMEADKKLNSVSAGLVVGRDRVEVNVQRQTTVNDETVHGHTDLKYTMDFGEGETSIANQVRQHNAKLFKDIISK